MIYKVARSDIIDLIEKDYEISCLHTLICDKTAKCSCYGDTLERIWNIFSSIISKNRYEVFIDTDEKNLERIFKDLCSSCSPNNTDPKFSTDNQKICFANFKMYPRTIGAEKTELMRNIVDILLCSDKNILGYRRKVGITKLSGACMSFSSKHKIDIINKPFLSKVYTEHGRRLANASYQVSEETFYNKVKDTVEEYLLDKFATIKCTSHFAQAIHCRKQTYKHTTGKYVVCRDDLIESVVSWVCMKLYGIVCIEEKEKWDASKSFKRKICLCCMANRGNAIKDEAIIECEKTFNTACCTFVGLIRFLTEVVLMSGQMKMISDPDNIFKSSAWMLACRKDNKVSALTTAIKTAYSDSKMDYTYNQYKPICRKAYLYRGKCKGENNTTG